MCTKAMSGSHFGVNSCACQPSHLRYLDFIGRTSGDVSQAKATMNSKRCLAWPVRELDADDEAPWQLVVAEAEPQNIKIKPSQLYNVNASA